MFKSTSAQKALTAVKTVKNAAHNMFFFILRLSRFIISEKKTFLDRLAGFGVKISVDDKLSARKLGRFQFAVRKNAPNSVAKS
jgi:hypothetical protein